MPGTIDALIEDTEVPTNSIIVSQDINKSAHKRTRWRQWFACISATLSMVAVGTVYGWMTTTLSRLEESESYGPVRVSSEEGAWIVSLTVIGSMIGPFLGAYLAEKYGRKRSLLSSSIFYIIGWTMILFATTVDALYLSRIILGIGVGISYTTNPMYVSEVADVDIRGAVGTLIAVNVFTGSLLACSIGPWVSYKLLGIIMLVIPILFLTTFIWFPETPHFLAANGRQNEAIESLAFFKGIEDREEARKELLLVLRGLSIHGDEHKTNKNHITDEANFLEEYGNIEHDVDDVKINKKQDKWSRKIQLMLTKSNLRALMIILALITAQQLSGNFSTMQYLEKLFKDAELSINSHLATVLVLAVGLVSGTIATATVEGAGRRPLLMISTMGSSITLAILATYLMFQKRGVNLSSISLLPVIDVIIFQVTFQIGLGTLPNALIGEFFPTNVKGMAGAIITIFDGVVGFAVSKLYQVLGDIFGKHAVYFFFAFSTLLAFVLVVTVVPETKGRTLREIQLILAGEEDDRTKFSVHCGNGKLDETNDDNKKRNNSECKKDLA